MPRLSRCAAALAALLLAAPTAQASTVNGFSSLWIFGDSLSDTGNFFGEKGQVGEEATFGRPYFEGRRSNGPLWSDDLAGDFVAKNRPNQNFAWIGATASLPNPPPVLNLPSQIDDFAVSGAPKSLGHRPLATLWFGANDLLAATPFGAGAAEKTGIAAANAVAEGARSLARLGIDDFVIFNLPNLANTPYYNIYESILPTVPPGSQDAAGEGTAAFNNTIAARIADLRVEGYNVIDIDIASLFEDLIEDPTQFGLSNATLPCLFIPTTGVKFGQPDDCTGDTPLERAFYDWLHPNSVVHAQIAGIVREAGVAPVPLPAPLVLMLAGFAGLGFVARRRAHA